MTPTVISLCDRTGRMVQPWLEAGYRALTVDKWKLRMRPMTFAYADPPYLGCGKLYAEHHPDALAWDDPKTHFGLIDRLMAEYPDGWVLSCHEPSLHILRNYAGDRCRTGIWVKPFAAFKPNVNPAYAWEPVIWYGGRQRTRDDDTLRDWVAENITLRRGLTGVKPRAFCRWVIQLVNAQRGDGFDDLFPGTGAFTAAWSEWVAAEAPQFEFGALTKGKGT